MKISPLSITPNKSLWQYLSCLFFYKETTARIHVSLYYALLCLAGNEHRFLLGDTTIRLIPVVCFSKIVGYLIVTDEGHCVSPENILIKIKVFMHPPKTC